MLLLSLILEEVRAEVIDLILWRLTISSSFAVLSSRLETSFLITTATADFLLHAINYSLFMDLRIQVCLELLKVTYCGLWQGLI